MKKILFLLLLLLYIPIAASAQNLTLVTSTVKDPAGTVYALGTYSISLVNSSPQQAQFGGSPNFQQTYSGSLDANGNLSITLPSNTVITPPGTQWAFNICANPGSIAAVFPRPALPCFTSNQAISGSSQVITFTATTIPLPSGGGSGLPAGCVSGTNPLVQCTQAANGNDTITIARNTDSAPTGTAYKFLNAAQNTVLYSVDVLGNVIGNSFQATALGAGYWQCSNGNGTLPTLVAGQFQLTCPAGAITNYQVVVPTGAGSGPLCGTNATNVVTLAFGGCGSAAGTQYQMAFYSSTGSVVGGDPNITTDASNDLNVGAAVSTASTSKLTYCTGASQSCFGGTEGSIATTDTTASTFKFIVDSAAHEAKLATNATNNYGLLDRTEPGSINSTGLTALVSTATLCAASAGACNVAGQYHIHVNIWGSGTACATPSPGGVTFSLTWTDENSVSHVAVVIPALSQSSATAVALVSSAPTMPFESALANEGASIDYTLSTSGAAAIQYAVAYTACGSGTGTYNLRASAVRAQ